MMSINGKIGFSVYSENTFDEQIEKILCITPKKIIKKGEKIGSHLIAPKNAWLYHIEFHDYDDFASKAVDFYDQLLGQQGGINFLKTKYDVSIDMYIGSDLGQMGYTLPTKMIKMASQIDLDINFHILSFGLVE